MYAQRAPKPKMEFIHSKYREDRILKTVVYRYVEKAAEILHIRAMTLRDS